MLIFAFYGASYNEISFAVTVLAMKTIALYRAEPVAPQADSRPEWIMIEQMENGHLAAEGRWFAQNLAQVAWYVNDIGGMDKARIATVDIPSTDLERYRVINQPEARRFSKDPENEFFIPAELAQQRRTVESQELIDTIRAEAHQLKNA